MRSDLRQRIENMSDRDRLVLYLALTQQAGISRHAAPSLQILAVVLLSDEEVEACIDRVRALAS